MVMFVITDLEIVSSVKETFEVLHFLQAFGTFSCMKVCTTYMDFILLRSTNYKIIS